MSSDAIKALTYDSPEYIPTIVSLLPATWMKYRDDLQALVDRHPIIFGDSSGQRRDFDAVSGKYIEGSHVDNWGCVWSNVAQGMDAIVTGHPLPTRESVRECRPPETLIGSLPHGFMFLRITDLRGYEEAMIDFAEEPEELQILIDKILDYNMRELEAMLPNYSPGSIIYFGDDLGMQTSLPMSPEKWRKYLKPCYMRVYQACCRAGLYVYMHTDGHIYEIIPDLVDCGVKVVNPQVRANGLDNLARVCKGKVCVNLDLDRQMFPFCTPADIEAHVVESIEKLGAPEGGLWLMAECAPDVPLENIEAICTALEKHRGYFRA